jgi:nitrate/nitrite transport system ATP-binding protein
MAGYVELYNLGKTYPSPNGPVVIVENFNLNIDQGEFVSIIGHSGCGKTTVLTMIAGLNSISTGSIVVANREIDGPGPDRGVVFQSPSLLPWMTPFENVMLGVKRVYPHASSAERTEIIEYYLSLVGLANAMHLRSRDLSQGMQQRVGIARAFALSPKMLLLDEPFGMLDSLTRLELQEVLLELLARDNKTTLMVTHDVDEALFMSDRIVMMTTGPRAIIGDILEVPFSRPRVRTDVLEHPEYYALRERLIGFLEGQAHGRPAELVA